MKFVLDEAILSKLKNIKALFMDVDGTLTDGHIYMSDSGEAFKAFHAHDGYGIKNILPRTGVVPVIMTGRKSKLVERRAGELSIEYIYQGVDNKEVRIVEAASELGITTDEIAYIGDDFNDYGAMQKCGFVACPEDAPDGIKEYVHYVCKKQGGRGAVRELIDLIAKAKETE